MQKLIIVTGLSGSGKSIALRSLEDSGYYCIDNLPASMLPNISQHLNNEVHEKVAISIDSRSAAIETLPEHVNTLRTQNIPTQVIYLESNVETLVKRFSETRRKHPLSTGTTTLAESITSEKVLLGNLSQLGHVIDTSHLSAKALRTWIKELVLGEHTTLTLLFTSFGFKHGAPLDADFIFDVRCLPNPHYDKTLRPLTGQDEPVKTFLKGHAMVDEMRNDITQYLEKWLPSFIDDNRSYLTVGIGCTGGQHRSVYMVEALSSHFKANQKVLTRHRELDNKSA
jgi:UPF0042 nucleotide-binding protein